MIRKNLFFSFKKKKRGGEHACHPSLSLPKVLMITYNIDLLKILADFSVSVFRCHVVAAGFNLVQRSNFWTIWSVDAPVTSSSPARHRLSQKITELIKLGKLVYIKCQLLSPHKWIAINIHRNPFPLHCRWQHSSGDVSRNSRKQ